MINRETIDKLAALSRIELSEGEKTKIAKELESVLGYVSELKNAPKYEVNEDEASHINIFREDLTVSGFEPGNFTDKIMAEAPRSDGKFVLVKQVLGEKGAKGSI
ncbi:MAG: aspartyl/glutamyl-tRNA amidotransferase subunit C [Candidatus Vogelbacteria bacterium]|nr:aspartyl/glutamyl-tRNA amidotransferase subunit C [Candidatus Vogelbacteria bacterium]